MGTNYSYLINQLINSLSKGRTELPGYQNFALMRNLLQKLGNPHCQLNNVIHVAGTNGKGSTCAFLTSFLESQGYSVNTYTSPHLVNITERIRVKGKDITEKDLYSYLTYLMKYHHAIPFNYFHALTASAILAYADSPADFTILETGMGGRFDATNIISKPLATLFTPIALDHQPFLGSTLGQIAAEKIAIAKPGAPMFSSLQREEVSVLLSEQAQKLDNLFFIEEEDWHYTIAGDEFTLNQGDGASTSYPLPHLAGAHQIQNASLALVTLQRLGLIKDAPAIKAAFKEVYWPGRLMRVHYNNREILMDGAHNISAAEVLRDYIRSRYKNEKINLIFSMTKPENVFAFLEILKPSLACVFTPYLDQPFIDRSIIQKTCLNLKIPYQEFDRLEACLERATSLPPSAILITGSLYLVGEALALIKQDV